MNKESLLEGIGSGRFGRIVMARIRIGVDLLDAVYEVVRRERIPNGLILMGIGALKKAVFRNLRVFSQEYPVEALVRFFFLTASPG